MVKEKAWNKRCNKNKFAGDRGGPGREPARGAAARLGRARQGAYGD